MQAFPDDVIYRRATREVATFFEQRPHLKATRWQVIVLWVNIADDPGFGALRLLARKPKPNLLSLDLIDLLKQLPETSLALNVLRPPLLTIIGLNLGVLFLQGAVLPYYRILNTAPEAIITPDGLCIGGSAYFWQQGNASLQSVDLAPGEPSALEFRLRVRRGRNRSTQVVRVPVLPGQEKQVQQVLTGLAPKA